MQRPRAGQSAALTIKDEASALALAIEPGYGFNNRDVRQMLERLFKSYGVPA